MVGGLAAVVVNGSAVQNCGQMSHKRVTKVCFRSVYKALTKRLLGKNWLQIPASSRMIR